ncbi:apolipoprotein N-acyltransferase [Ahniella affigens]|uniref:Apolipoprotein N-acyltransferase n=1 Tax=Ahniella affigens TaxID=2021234 RepID=A0A2P1PPB3_9GAMM|nr:apolipoprotein N-acyltransferase [Ahniella affigens]AVP96683.1 apolipoprotein N-acyltransferase [Ahniella affigens]
MSATTGLDATSDSQRTGARLWPWLGVLASALLLHLYARGGWFWLLGFVVWVPWILSLGRLTRWSQVCLSGVAMAVGYALAATHWFAPAFGDYVGIHPAIALLILMVLAPLLQAQVLVFVLLRHRFVNRMPWLPAALLSALAWVGAEWLVPKLLGDTFGHGLQAASWLRQAADLAGVSGLTLILVLINLAIAEALKQVRSDRRQALQAVSIAAVIGIVWTGYGYWRLLEVRSLQAMPAQSVRVGLVQANITKLEAMRAERGAYAVIRHLLDTHYAMSAHAVQQQGAEALLWSETIYPTTFGSPKSDDGAALDQEIMQFVRDVNVPLVMGTYDRDAAGEYNSAAFLEPERGLLGHYRKTYPFPLTEYVPSWLDGERFRKLLPWTGSWREGDGARALPLRTSDGREINVVPLICLDDVHPQLAIDGARLGAQALIGLSNDSWFTEYRQGARLHLAVASFRSVETRLPQLRVTANGYSAIVDESGEIIAQTDMDQQAVLVGEVPIRSPEPTVMVRWGDWLGRVAAWIVGLTLLAPVLGRIRMRLDAWAGSPKHESPMAWSATVYLLRPSARILVLVLHACAALGLLWIAIRMLWTDGLQVNTLHQVHLFLASVAVPMLLAHGILLWNRYQARFEGEQLLMTRGATHIEIEPSRIQSLQVFRMPRPYAAVALTFDSGQVWSHHICVHDPVAFSEGVRAHGGAASWQSDSMQRAAEQASRRAGSWHRWLDAPWLQYGLWPLLMSLPAFRLNQVITFGGTFGEWQTFGPGAWFLGLLIWWVAWAIGISLLGGALRGFSDALTWLLGRWRLAAARSDANLIQWLRRAVFYLGVPIWLAIRVLGA